MHVTGPQIPLKIACCRCDLSSKYLAQARSGVPYRRLLELRVPGRSWEGNHVADVRHAGDKLHHPLEAQTEAGVGHAAEAAQIEVPPIVGLVEALLVHAGFENIEPIFA